MANDRPILRKFGENLRNLRLNLKYSQVDFAKSIGITQAAISHFEAGDRDPGLDLIFQIAEKFSVPVTDLIPIEETNIADDVSAAVSGLVQKKPSWLDAFEKAKHLTDHEANLVIEMIDCLSKKDDSNE